MIEIITQEQSDSALIAKTDGLFVTGHPEVMVEIHEPTLLEEAKDFLRCVSDYVIEGAKLKADQTLGYGYWLTKFRNGGENTLETWEYNATATDFVKGASLTLKYWKDQNSICERYRAAFQPPSPDQLSVISKGVFEGLPVQGVRYPSPDNMSGWWITTDEYDGDVGSLRKEHTYHLTASRPDLAKYLALPYGFRFDLSTFEDVWYEQDVANA